MDSGNSGGGSMQSSSTGGGGDEEFDSRAAADSSSISAFFNNPPLSNHHSSMFDPLSNYFDPSSSRVPQQLSNPNNNSFLNLDTVWSKNLRSDPNLTNFNPTQQFFTQTRPDYPPLQIPQSQQQQQPPTSRPSPTTDQPNPDPVARNPKKRSRASRRAPTTVLTTDTSNFRAMVQEFTGIPAPPFTSSPFPRSRLDLFGGASSTLRSVIASHHHHQLDPTTAPPTYLLRPFAQKLQQPLSFAPSSSMVEGIAPTVSAATNAASNNNNTNASTSVNYQLPPQQQQQQSLFNMNQQTPLNFQPMKFPPAFGSNPKQQQPSDQSGLKNMGGGLEDQFGLRQGHVSPSSSNPVGSNWPGDDHQGADHHHHHQNHHHHQEDLLRSINSNYSTNPSSQQQQQRGGGGKVVNFSGSSSDVHGDKGEEAAGARNEGVMESWICSSD